MVENASAIDESEYEISTATAADVPAMLALQNANLISNGGMLSVEFSGTWFEATLAEMPIILARREGRLIAYAVSSMPAATRELALSQAKFGAYPAGPTSYNYGPICIAVSERGRGLAAQLFGALRSRLPGREAVGFIRKDNDASLRAHAKLGLEQVAEFTHNDVGYVVVACRH
jgi:L-amino acid N-acyltransferase YncA